MEVAPNKKTPEAGANREPADAFHHEDESSFAAEHLSTGRYEPRDLGELMRYCKIVVQSQLCPRHIKSPADAMLIIQRGAELGLSAVNSLQNLNVISGNVTMPAALAVGVVKASDACEYFTCIESADEYSTWETKRRGNPEPTRYTFSKHDAQVAGLWGSGTWRKYPRNLLAARASMNLARMEYQDVLVGVYTPEELEVNAAPRPAPSPRGATRKAPPAPEKAQQIAQPENLAPPQKSQTAQKPEKAAPKKERVEAEVERPLHWSEAPIKNARDRSRTKAWQAQNERFHGLMRAVDVEPHCQAFRQFIKERHRAAAWGVLPAELIGKWCDLIAKHSDAVDEKTGAPSERSRWVEETLLRHAEAKAGLPASAQSKSSKNSKDSEAAE